MTSELLARIRPDETVYDFEQLVLARAGAPGVGFVRTGLEELDKRGIGTAVQSSKSKEFDIPQRRDIIELCGRSGSGKTELCMYVVVSCILPVELGGSGGTVLFFDLDMRLNAERIVEILLSRIEGLMDSDLIKDEEQGNQIAQECMERVLIFRCPGSLEVLTTLRSFGAKFIRERNVKLMVFDSIGSFHHVDCETESIKTGFHVSIPSSLRDIVRQHDISILATKPILFTPQNQYPPSCPEYLSETWHQLVSTQLVLEPIDVGVRFRVFDTHAKNVLFSFEIDKSGIVVDS